MMDQSKVKKSDEVKLKVVEALQDDVHKGVARIDPTLMRSLGLNRGDVISIKGERETVAIVDRAYPADVGERIIRIDGLIRRNAKTSVGEQIVIKKSAAKRAIKVNIAPAQQGLTVHADPEMLKNGLLGRAVIKGDLLALGGRRRDMMNEGFPDFFGDLNDLFGGNLAFSFKDIKFVVVATRMARFGNPCVELLVELEASLYHVDDLALSSSVQRPPSVSAAVL